MALNWEWSDKMGEAIGTAYNGEERVCNLYKGNAYMISVYEDAETNTYNVSWFACDKDHLKNILGLSAGHSNVFKDFGIKKIRLDTSYKHVPTIVNMIARAKFPIEIELY